MIYTKEQVDALLFGEGVTAANRFSTFLRHRRRITSNIDFYALGQAYRHAAPNRAGKKIMECFREVKRVKSFNREAVSPIMNEEEKAYLAQLPKELTLYQWVKKGGDKEEATGASWRLETCPGRGGSPTSAVPERGKKLRWLTVSKQEVLALFLRPGWVEVVFLKSKQSRNGMYVVLDIYGPCLIDGRESTFMFLNE